MASGRDIHGLYPHLDVWEFGIPLYLFIGGLSAGILLFATYFYLKGKADEMPATVKISTLLPPFIIVAGLLFLIGDLHHPQYFWQLMLHFEIGSPMSWGSWILIVVLLISVLWPLSFMKDINAYFQEAGRKRFAKWSAKIVDLIEKIGLLRWLVEFTTKNRKTIAYVTFFLAIALGIYTGILLSSFNARPLWNTSILGPLFLISGVSTGAATIMWMSRDKKEKLLYSRIDLVLIGIELLLIFLMFLGMAWGPEVFQQTASMFLGGEFTAVFWGVFVGLGLVLPAVLEALELKGFHVPIALPAILILAGGLIFRVILVIAGQISSYIF